jgi:capsular polysaccharide biosynthesis protein
MDLIRSMQMHGDLAVCVALAGVFIAAIFLMLMNPSYTAESLIDVQPQQYDPSALESYLQQQVNRVTRHDVLAAAFRRLEGDDWQHEGEGELAAIERLGHAVRVTRVAGSYQIAVSGTAADPDSAARVANAVADSYIQATNREQPGSARLAGAAVAPLHPAESSRIRIAVYVAIAFCFFGLIAAIVANNLDPNIYIPADIERVIGFAPMGALPDAAEVPEAVIEEHLLSLAAALEHAHQQGMVKNCIFTGAGAGAGVTTIVTRVHAILGAMGKSAALMDASSSPTAPPDMPPPIETSDTISPRISQRGSRSTALRRSMAEEGREQSLVLTDAAPLPISAETEYLVRFADAVIVVVESGRTTREQLHEVAAALQRLNVSAVGFVLNRVTLKKATPAFRASVRAMEKHLRDQDGTDLKQIDGRKAVPAEVNTTMKRNIDNSSDGAPGDARNPRPASTSHDEPTATSAEAAAQATPPIGTDWATFLAEAEEALAQLRKLPQIEAATKATLQAASDRAIAERQWEQVLPVAGPNPLAKQPIEPIPLPAEQKPWWVVDPMAKPDPPQFTAPGRPLPGLEPDANPQLRAGTRDFRVSARSATPWRPIPVERMGIEHETSTEEAMELELGPHSNNLVSRLSSLRNLSGMLSRRQHEIPVASVNYEPFYPARFESEALRPAFDNIRPMGAGEAVESNAPSWVADAARILNSESGNEGRGEASARSTNRPFNSSGSFNRAQLDALDESPTLPSKRGQYNPLE